MLLIMAVTLYTSRVILNTLGVEDFGIYNVVGGVVTFFTFLNSSMAGATSRFFAIELGKQNFEQYKKVYSVTIVNHIILGLFIIVLAETIGLWFLQTKLVIPEERKEIAFWVYQFSILSTFISIMRVPFSASIIAHEKMKMYAYGGIIEAISKLVIAITLGFISYDKLGFYAIAILGMTLFMTLFYFYYIRISYTYCRFSLQRDKSLYKQMLSYAGWELFGGFSTVAQGQGLNMILNVFFGPLVNAAQGIAVQVQGAISQFGSNFMIATRPQIIKYYASGGNAKMMNLVFHSAKYSFYLMWLLTLPMLIETKYILTLWLKNVPAHTVSFTRIVLLISLISTFRNPFIAAMHATGKIQLPNLICGTLLIAVLPISYLFLKLGYPAESVYIITLIITFISMWLEFILIKRTVYFSISDVIRKVLIVSLIVALISVALPFLIYYLLDSGFIRFCIVSFLSILSVVLAVYFLGIGKNERTYFTNKIKFIFHKQ